MFLARNGGQANVDSAMDYGIIMVDSVVIQYPDYTFDNYVGCSLLK